MANTTVIEHKRGDTFALVGQVPAAYPDGHFAGGAVACQVRDGKDVLVHEMAATWADPATTRVLNIASGATPTTAWPVGRLLLDVQFTRADGTVLSTRTLTILCVQDITHG